MSFRRFALSLVPFSIGVIKMGFSVLMSEDRESPDLGTYFVVLACMVVMFVIMVWPLRPDVRIMSEKSGQESRKPFHRHKRAS